MPQSRALPPTDDPTAKRRPSRPSGLVGRVAVALIASMGVASAWVGTAAASSSGNQSVLTTTAPSTVAPSTAVPSLPALPAPTPPEGLVPIFVSGPPPGAIQLLDAVSHDEGQLVSLGAITEANFLLGKAKAAQARAVLVVDRAVGSWDAARIAVEEALGRQLQAEATASFIYSALGQLGLAEYTGAASVTGSASLTRGDLASQESQMYQAELTTVAANATSGNLEAAEVKVAKDRQVVDARRWVAGRAWSVLLRDRASLERAGSQLALSMRDVALARRWALQQGTAPLYPVEAILKLEGPLGRQVLGGQTQVRPGHATGSTTTTTPPTEIVAGASTSVPATPLPSGGSLSAPAGAQPSPSVTFLGGKLPPAVDGPGILGPSLLTESQIVGWFGSGGVMPNVTTTLNQLVWDYMEAGRLTGVRADLAFAQSIVETGHFDFPAGGQLTRKDNNFAGIGACDSCKTGWKFRSAMAGVMAQEELLQAYATPVGYGTDISTMAGGVQGCCTTWLALSGVWASNPNYGYEILGIYKEMLDWAIPRQLLQDGLISPARFAQEELLLPAEDARTYALVAGAISSTPGQGGGTGASCPSTGASKAGPTTTSAPVSTTAPTTSTTATAPGSKPTTTSSVPSSCRPVSGATTTSVAASAGGATTTTGANPTNALGSTTTTIVTTSVG